MTDEERLVEMQSTILEKLTFDMLTSLIFNISENPHWPKKIKEWFHECKTFPDKRRIFYSMIYDDWFGKDLKVEAIKELKFFEESIKEPVDYYWKKKTSEKFLMPTIKEIMS